MSRSITLKPDIALGIVPTHLRFVGGLVPDAEGRLPRNADGEIIIVAGVGELLEVSPVAFRSAQVSLFPGTQSEELDRLVAGLKALGLDVEFLFINVARPLEPRGSMGGALQEAALRGSRFARKARLFEVTASLIQRSLGSDGNATKHASCYEILHP
jgi:hypothetical protein